MSTQRRLLAALGVAAGAALLFAPMAAAAPYGCASGECTLELGGDPTNVGYLGWRPFVTEWWGIQPVDVVDQDGVTLGTYPVGVMDFQFPMLLDASYYQYHEFAPAADGPDGDPYGLSWVALYDVGFGPGLGGPNGATDVAGNSVLFDSLTGFDPKGTYYWIVSGPDGFKNTLEVSLTKTEFPDSFSIYLFNSSDYLTLPGHDAPIMLWDTLPHNELGPVDIATMLPPDSMITWP